MAPSDRTPLISKEPAVGTFAPAPPGASRSPCPAVNALANHGYIDRSGRNIYPGDMHAAMKHVGLSYILGGALARSPYLDFNDPATAYLRKPPGFWAKLWLFFKNPYSLLFSALGVWGPTVNPIAGSHLDARGNRTLDLERLAVHGAIEHDISPTRRDTTQKEGANVVQLDLVEQLLASSSDGGETISAADFAAFIRARIQQQLADNPGLAYGDFAHTANCGNPTMVMKLFGDGKSVKCSYVRALFAEERLPVAEGWRRRWLWTLGPLEFGPAVKRFKKLVGLDL